MYPSHRRQRSALDCGTAQVPMSVPLAQTLAKAGVLNSPTTPSTAERHKNVPFLHLMFSYSLFFVVFSCCTIFL